MNARLQLNCFIARFGISRDVLLDDARSGTLLSIAITLRSMMRSSTHVICR